LIRGVGARICLLPCAHFDQEWYYISGGQTIFGVCVQKEAESIEKAHRDVLEQVIFSKS